MSSAMNKTRVVVYGSLKRGFGNHRLLDAPSTRFLGRDVITGPYVMVSLGGFPGVVEVEDKTVSNDILGEVYEVDVDTLHSLDLLEGHPEFYTRRKVRGTHVDGKLWLYFLPTSYLDNPRVESGCWRPEANHEPNNAEQDTFRRERGAAA